MRTRRFPLPIGHIDKSDDKNGEPDDSLDDLQNKVGDCFELAGCEEDDFCEVEDRAEAAYADDD